jgi:hypothetical protein
MSPRKFSYSKRRNPSPGHETSIRAQKDKPVRRGSTPAVGDETTILAYFVPLSNCSPVGINRKNTTIRELMQHENE